MKKALITLALVLAVFSLSAQKTFAIACGSLNVIPGIGDSCVPGKPVDINVVLTAITNWLTGLIGAVIVLVIIISGIQLAASAGNPDGIATAKKHIFNAVLSLIVLIALRAILLLLGIVA